MESARSSSLLHREVLPPQKAEHGFGVLLVTSVAIFFAVMSSAFILQARTVRTCPGEGATPVNDGADPTNATRDMDVGVDVRALELYESANTPRIRAGTGPMEFRAHRSSDVASDAAPEMAAPDVASDVECGRPFYRENPDGSTSVFFEICPEDRVIEVRPLLWDDIVDRDEPYMEAGETVRTPSGIVIRHIER